MAENMSQFAPSENISTGHSAFGKAPVGTGSYRTRRGSPMSSTSPKQPWKVVVVESRGKSCNSCHVSMPSPEKQEKQQSLSLLHYKIAKVAKSCRWNVQIWANISISNALHFIPKVCPVACWMTPGYWLMLSRESLALIGWLVGLGRASQL